MSKLFCPFLQIPGNEGILLRYSDCRWQIPRGHRHDRLEMNLVLKGRGEVLFRDRKYPLLPGHLIWILPRQWHAPLNWSDDLEMWIAEFEPALLAKAERGGCRGLQHPDPSRRYCRRVSSERLRELDQALGAAETAILDYPTFNQGLLFALHALWGAFGEAEEVGEARSLHASVNKAIDLLNQPGNGELAVKEMARRIGVSSGQLSARFRREVGQTIPEYRQRLRLQRFFEKYEKEPHANLLFLALESGFGSYAQFHRVFKQHLHKSPRAWLAEV